MPSLNLHAVQLKFPSEAAEGSDKANGTRGEVSDYVRGNLDVAYDHQMAF